MLLDNKAIVCRLYEEVWNKRRLQVVDELIAPSHALNDPIVFGSQIGPEFYKRRGRAHDKLSRPAFHD